ncbi:hypothetical protein LCGC14_2361970 [marine sediment metagenome]|uniref:Uncharacterized protein n=1 Tax=marine sediment metagenome TaxID=412755 RepID=A0A0F9C690_9ZZZZ
MSSPGEAAGTYRTVREARIALESQGFKHLKGKVYRVVRDRAVYDAQVETDEPFKKVVVRITRVGKPRKKREKKKDVKTDGSTNVSIQDDEDSGNTTQLREAE